MSVPLRQPRAHAAEFVPKSHGDGRIPVRTASAPPTEVPIDRRNVEPFRPPGNPSYPTQSSTFSPNPNPSAPNPNLRSNAVQFIPGRGYGGGGGVRPRGPPPPQQGYSNYYPQQRPRGPPPVFHHPPPPVREKKPLLIVDPKTNDTIKKQQELGITKKKGVAGSTTLRATSVEFSPASMRSPAAQVVPPMVASPVPPPAAAACPVSTAPSMMFGSVETETVVEPPIQKVMSPIRVQKKQEMVVVSPVVSPVPAPKSEKPILTALQTLNLTSESAAARSDSETDSETEDWETKELKVKTPVKAIPEPDTWNAKIVYSMSTLWTFKDKFSALPLAAKGRDSTWETMEIDPMDIAVAPRHRGGRGGGGDNGGGKPSSQWSRSQDLPRQAGGRGGGRGGRGGRGRGGQQELCFDGPIKPLERTDNRWVPSKTTTRLEEVSKAVQSIMNKMTREKFDRLATSLCQLQMDSYAMLQAVITMIFDKALDESHFCDMYADLCVHLSQKWNIWNFLQIVEKSPTEYFWICMGEPDAEVVGPFADLKDVYESIDAGAIIPIPAEDLVLKTVIMREERLISIWTDSTGTSLYWSGQAIVDLTAQTITGGPFPTPETCKHDATKNTSFKRTLLNYCQQEFQKDNVYEDAVIDETASAEEQAETVFLRQTLKRRMLGNIRFIGELYKKGMLREQIMHECVDKLLFVRKMVFDQEGYPTHLLFLKDPITVDEESLESLSKLLTTIGKKMEANGRYHLNVYFTHLRNIVEAPVGSPLRVCTRIRFMLKDVLELRASNWTPRRAALKQKTLDEIRKDADKELMNEQKKAALANKNQRGGGGCGGGYQQQPRGGGVRGHVHQQQNAPQRPQFVSRPSSTRPKTLLTKQSTSNLHSTPKAAPKPKPMQNTETLQKAIKPIVMEFVRIRDVEEATTCLALLNDQPGVGQVLVRLVFTLSMTAKNAEREAMLELVWKVAGESSGPIKTADLEMGLVALIADGPNVRWDVPQWPAHMAVILAKCQTLSHGTLSLGWLVRAPVSRSEWQEFVDSGLCQEVLAKALLLDVEGGRKTLEDSNVNVITLLPPNDKKRYYQIVQAWVATYPGLEELLQLKHVFYICECLAGSKSSKVNDAIKYIQERMSDADRQSCFFVNHLTSFLFQLTNNELCHEDLIRGICFGPACEKACLYGIQQTMPKQAILPLFKQLHAAHVVSPAAFKHYSTSDAKINAFIDTLKV